MNAVRGIRESFHPNEIRITVEGVRNLQEIQNEINRSLPDRVRHIQTTGETSEYLVDNLVKVVTPSVEHSLEQVKLWKKLRNLHIIGIVLSTIWSSMSILAGLIYWLYKKAS